MGGAAVPRHPKGPLPLYLQALVAAGVPPDEVLGQAEAAGAGPEELVRIACLLLPHRWSMDPEMAAVCLALGSARRWKSLQARARTFGLALVERLASMDTIQDLESLREALGLPSCEHLRRRVLRRLGYPPDLITPVGRTTPNPIGALQWLEEGRGLAAPDLEFRDFSSSAARWELHAERLVLRDGFGPRQILWSQSPSRGDAPPTARCFRIRGLRELKGIPWPSILAAADCPELETIQGTPSTLVAMNCPRLSDLLFPDRGGLLHLERCAGIRSLWVEASPEEDPYLEWNANGWHTLVLDACPALRFLPERLRVNQRMVLRRMGPFERWPRDFRVDGELRIQDCPDITELPALDVGGTLRVEGASGLRRLSPGTVVGRNLDLRACDRLEGLPHGLKVRGRLMLPPHMQHRTQDCGKPQLLLDLPREYDPAVRAILLGLRFRELCAPSERLDARERAHSALKRLRRELRDDPGAEEAILWAAAEAWRDFSDARCDADSLWGESSNGQEDELPVAWFRNLLYTS